MAFAKGNDIKRSKKALKCWIIKSYKVLDKKELLCFTQLMKILEVNEPHHREEKEDGTQDDENVSDLVCER